MDASIVITTYNQSKLLNLILLSLANQNTKFTFEIIVCDDGGLNTTNHIVQKFSKMFTDIPIYYLWQQDKRFRAGQARNMGIRQSIGKIIILLDGDMIPTNDFVQKHINYHRKHPNSLLTGSRKTIDDKILFTETHSQLKNKDFLDILQKKSSLNKEELDYRRIWYKSTRPWMCVFSCNLSFPRNTFARYCEEFVGWGIEDWDFSLRLYKAGFSIKFSESIIAYHVDYKPVISNAFRNNNHEQMVEFARNVMLLIDQYPGDNLEGCAIALNNYVLKANKWQWAGDNVKLRDNKESIKLLRGWLLKNQIYKRKKTSVEPKLIATVIIACYEHTDYFEKILYSLKQQYDSKFEIILVDDGSSSTAISKYQKLLQACNIPSKLIWQPNRGFRVAKSRNNGIKQSLGDILIFLDGDMIPSQSFIKKHVSFHKNNSKKVLAGNRKLLSEKNFLTLKLNRNFFSNLYRYSKPFRGEESFRLQVAKLNKHTWRLGFTCNLSVKRASILFFDENIANKFGHEDLELMYRLHQDGCKFIYKNNLLAYHIGYKKPGYAVHEGATNSEIINHMLTSLYVVTKHSEEPFMWAFLDCTRYFHLNKNGQWYFSLKNPKSLTTGLTDFTAWLLKSQLDLSATKH